MLVPIFILTQRHLRVVNGFASVWLPDRKCITLRSSALLFENAIPYIWLLRDQKNVFGDWVYIIYRDDGSITLSKEQEELYGLL